MKILLTSDWHLDMYRPKNRIDVDFFENQALKVHWILNLAFMESCDVIINGGDLFNSHRANDFIKEYYIRLFKSWEGSSEILSVYGQHDLRYHNSDRRNTPLGVLEAARVITMLGAKPIMIGDLNIYGASWNEPIPKIVVKGGFNILAMHFLTFLNDKHPPLDAEQFQLATHLLMTTDFDLILTGDNHQTFSLERNGKTLVNPGSLMRAHIDQYDHKPCVFLYDTNTRELKQEFLDVLPINDVLNIEKAREEKEKNEELQAFVQELAQGVLVKGLNFKRNLWSFVKSTELEKGVVSILEEVMDDGS